ncbi:gluconate 5-dehydrogenase [Yersinia wautersii]|nr:gluconate 5-dehydrogenase [Yersinia wautersii]
MDVFTASLRSACSLRRGHFVNNLKGDIDYRPFAFW